MPRHHTCIRANTWMSSAPRRLNFASGLKQERRRSQLKEKMNATVCPVKKVPIAKAVTRRGPKSALCCTVPGLVQHHRNPGDLPLSISFRLPNCPPPPRLMSAAARRLALFLPPDHADISPGWGVDIKCDGCRRPPGRGWAVGGGGRARVAHLWARV